MPRHTTMPINLGSHSCLPCQCLSPHTHENQCQMRDIGRDPGGPIAQATSHDSFVPLTRTSTQERVATRSSTSPLAPPAIPHSDDEQKNTYVHARTTHNARRTAPATKCDPIVAWGGTGPSQIHMRRVRAQKDNGDTTHNIRTRDMQTKIFTSMQSERKQCPCLGEGANVQRPRQDVRRHV